MTTTHTHHMVPTYINLTDAAAQGHASCNMISATQRAALNVQGRQNKSEIWPVLTLLLLCTISDTIENTIFGSSLAYLVYNLTSGPI